MARRSVLLLVQLFIDDEAGQDSISSKTINSHEDGTNSISEDEDNLKNIRKTSKFIILTRVGMKGE